MLGRRKLSRELLSCTEMSGGYMRELNGMRVIKRTKDVIFVRLPITLQRECGTCTCQHCKRAARVIGHWDTLAIPVQPSLMRGQDTTWIVHMPEEE